MSSNERVSPIDDGLVVIFNKRALAARALRRSGLEEMLRERKLPHEIIDTSTADEARDAAEAAARDGKIVVAAGGDGTARDVVNGLLASGYSEPVMGLVPLGTGNDLVRALGRVVEGLERALDALLEGFTAKIDVGQVNGEEYFVNVFGVGFDAEVLRRRLARKIRLPGYFPGVVRTILDYEPQRYRISWPGGEREGMALMVAALNGSCEGGGFRVAPEASLDDGLLDVYWIDPVSLWMFARYVWAVRRGTHGRLAQVKSWRADKMKVESDARIQYHVDGEYHELPVGQPLEVVVHRQRLRMIV